METVLLSFVTLFIILSLHINYPPFQEIRTECKTFCEYNWNVFSHSLGGPQFQPNEAQPGKYFSKMSLFASQYFNFHFNSKLVTGLFVTGHSAKPQLRTFVQCSLILGHHLPSSNILQLFIWKGLKSLSISFSLFENLDLLSVVCCGDHWGSFKIN